MLPLRAIENRMYIIRAANSGISCVIDPKGRIQKSLGINQQGIITATIFKNKDKTFYSKYLTLINTGFIILSLLLLIFLSDIKALVSP
jgi:apolipoprotein N-acyltransferase